MIASTVPTTRTGRLTTEQIKALARQGAHKRFIEIQSEISAIKATFPEFGRSRRTNGARILSNREVELKKGDGQRRRKMNAAQRKEVSERMTKYWAAWRAKRDAKAKKKLAAKATRTAQ